MKYQIILESSIILSDQEFHDAFRLMTHPDGKIVFSDGTHFKIVEARSLEGIREEVWKRKEELKEININAEEYETVETAIEKTFDDLSDLFKLM